MALSDGYLFFKLLTWGRICTSMTSWFSSESSGMETVVSHVVFSLVPFELKDYHVTNRHTATLTKYMWWDITLTVYMPVESASTVVSRYSRW
jgi:hypothetical protein